jgi:5'-AMP-activated protein kinase catalytic alpha subunit
MVVLPAAKRLIDKYELMDTIGVGRYSVCKRCCTPDGQLFALKIFEKSDQANEIHATMEVRCTKFISHPNIIRTHRVIASRKNIFLVQELASRGSLASYLAVHHHLPERGCSPSNNTPLSAAQLFAQLMTGVYFAHSSGFVHCDIKAENCVLTGSGVLKLCDFGSAFNCHEEIASCFGIRGTLTYTAPEVLLRSVQDPFKTDVWSCGVLLYLMVMGHFPFQINCEPTTIDQRSVINQIMCSDLYIPSNFSIPLRDLLFCMLQRDPCIRINVSEVLQHPWLNNINLPCT